MAGAGSASFTLSVAAGAEPSLWPASGAARPPRQGMEGWCMADCRAAAPVACLSVTVVVIADKPFGGDAAPGLKY